MRVNVPLFVMQEVVHDFFMPSKSHKHGPGLSIKVDEIWSHVIEPFNDSDFQWKKGQRFWRV